jgi:hypothetical protein
VVGSASVNALTAARYDSVLVQYEYSVLAGETSLEFSIVGCAECTVRRSGPDVLPLFVIAYEGQVQAFSAKC